MPRETRMAGKPGRLNRSNPVPIVGVPAIRAGGASPSIGAQKEETEGTSQSVGSGWSGHLGLTCAPFSRLDRGKATICRRASRAIAVRSQRSATNRIPRLPSAPRRRQGWIKLSLLLCLV
jgi:hypothetical protein